MARFTYKADTAMGQVAAEAIDKLIEGQAGITRAANAITLMDAAQAQSEMGVPEAEFPGFRSGLNQLKAALAEDPFAQLLPNYDQG